MPLITVSDTPTFDEGTYPARLTKIIRKTIQPKTGSQAGQDVDVFEWTFQLLDPEDGSELADEETGEKLTARATTSISTHPKSKLISFLVAMIGPSAAEPGATFEAEDLVGKVALASVVSDSGGFPKVESLTAKPKSRRAAAAAPAEEAPAPKAAASDEDDDLPF